MRIVCIGGGPASLYFSILMKKAYPECDITVYERNRADDTFGWGVVFSDETLGNFEQADPDTYDEITQNFAYWGDIDTHYGDTCIRSTGHGFSGLSRKKLLQIFHDRSRDLGVELRFEHEITDVGAYADADLLVGGDGVTSLVREHWADHFRPSIELGTCRFCWLGTTKPLDAFTFIFRENEHGLFQVHAYPFQDDRSTFIVECPEATWRRAGLDQATESETVAYMQALFADHLDGYDLLTNKSIWRRFPIVKNATWFHENVVLLGDAAHTAHFSIGSGTKLAMEDAIALSEAFHAYGTEDVPKVLQAYENARWVDSLKIQKAARTSQSWFENTERYMGQDPLPFTFNLMTRSKRITYDNLAARDPELVERVTAWFADETGMTPGAEGKPPAPMFSSFRLRSVRLPNRVVVSPMCQYSAVDGMPDDWHLVHLGARAMGGAGLVMTEMTNVSPEGRITYGCAGIYDDAHVDGWGRIVDFVHAHSEARIGMQLGHAGRKGSCHLPWEGDDPLSDDSAWPVLGPSAVAFDTGWPVPRAMDRADMDRVRGQYEAATRRAEAAGFDVLEIHMAHGYLLSSFVSPATNHRDDAYGGSLENRMRFPLEIFDAVRSVWPEEKPISVRISASDWLPAGEGLASRDAVAVSRMLQEHGCDIVDVSSGGNTPASAPEYGRMYQVPFAERIRYEVGIPVMAVGAILGPDHVNTIVAAGRADLCALARPHLVNPHVTLGAAVRYGYHEQFWPKPYLPAKPQPRDPREELRGRP
ncbi:MAG: bifunctional salicylyl-CoA 5-hydroxylase/oxidoreductase [Planctomycetota bacterium]